MFDNKKIVFLALISALIFPLAGRNPFGILNRQRQLTDYTCDFLMEKPQIEFHSLRSGRGLGLGVLNLSGKEH